MTQRLAPVGLGRLHDGMAARVARRELPGLVTLLACGDDVHVDAIGSYGFDDPTPMRRDTLFRVASLTKPILAAATMTLVEDGLLDPAESVDRLLPELADRRVLARIDGPLADTVPARRPITVDDLLTLRLGFGTLTEPTFNPPFPIVAAGDELRLALGPPDPRSPHPPDEWIRLFARLPLMAQPGERWLYNAGSLVLGVLVERAAGAPLPDVLRVRIFEPLTMTDTGFWTSAQNAARIPGYYMTDAGAGTPARQPVSTPEEWTRPPVFPSGAGGLLSTVDDLLAFARMLLAGGQHPGGRLLSAESVRLMTTDRLTPDQRSGAGVVLAPHGWGYGMGVVVEPDEMSAVPGRYGWSGGYGTVWFNDPHRELVAIALTQTTDFLFNGGLAEFTALALRAADAGTPPLRQRLRSALPAALKARDSSAVAALRSTLAAIENAEAIDGPAALHRGMAIEHSPVGAGAAEVARRELTDAQVAEIVRAEVAEREAAARDYERTGMTDRAERLRREAGVLAAHLAGTG